MVSSRRSRTSRHDGVEKRKLTSMSIDLTTMSILVVSAVACAASNSSLAAAAPSLLK